MKANRLLDVSRAARLAGVSREELQRLIAAGELEAFEGKVDIADLAKIYPEIERRPASMLEFVSQVKEDAMWKAPFPQLQDATSLRSEVHQLRTEVAYHKQQAEAYRRIFTDLTGMLMDLQEKIEQKQRVKAIINWLERKLKDAR
jgi:CDP-4-dehydro-6-deoxyglucose reductase